MWISRTLFEELSRTRVLAENLASELAATRAREDERRRAVDRTEAALESIIADLRQQVAVKQNSFEWLATSHERIERWYVELLAQKLEVHVPTSQIVQSYTPGMPGPVVPRPVGEGVGATDDTPSDIESLYRKQSGALFDDVGDAIATREGIPSVVYEGAEPVIAQG
jgi:hypothetical protein